MSSWLAMSPLNNKWVKPAIVGTGILCVLLLVGAVVYKIATFRLVPAIKIEAKKPLADCTKRVEVGDLWADPLRLRCGRAGEVGGRLACVRILAAPGFDKVRSCFNPSTIGQAQAR